MRAGSLCSRSLRQRHDIWRSLDIETGRYYYRNRYYHAQQSAEPEPQQLSPLGRYGSCRTEWHASVHRSGKPSWGPFCDVSSVAVPSGTRPGWKPSHVELKLESTIRGRQRVRPLPEDRIKGLTRLMFHYPDEYHREINDPLWRM